jgi:transcriptional regulator with XRE-family HTH domain
MEKRTEIKKKKNIEVEKEFEDLFEFDSKEENYNHEARMIMFRFLGEIERHTGQKRGLKNQLAQIVGKSKSFISQLFRGDKMINLYNLAKIQDGLGIKFRITAIPENDFIYNYVEDENKMDKYIFILENKSEEISKTVGTNEGGITSQEFVQIVPKASYVNS